MSKAIEDLETPSSKIGESAQRIIDRAEHEARRRHQALTTVSAVRRTDVPR